LLHAWLTTRSGAPGKTQKNWVNRALTSFFLSSLIMNNAAYPPQYFFDVCVYTAVLMGGEQDVDQSSYQQSEDAMLIFGVIDDKGNGGIHMQWTDHLGVSTSAKVPAFMVREWKLKRVVSKSGHHRGIVLSMIVPLPIFEGDHGEQVQGYDGLGFNLWKLTFKIVGQEDFQRMRNAAKANGFRNGVRETRNTPVIVCTNPVIF
jgi:hypothetical protein